MADFREFTTSSGKKVLSGKDSRTNELLVEQTEAENIVLHTAKPGSPFAEIKSNEKKANKQDIKEAAIFIAKFSQDWKKNHGEVLVHYFLGRDIFKTAGMKEGCFGVKKYKEILIKKRELEK